MNSFINIGLRVWICLTVLLCVPISNGQAQQYSIGDTVLAKKLIADAHDSAVSYPKASLATAERLLKLSQSIEYKNGIAAGLTSIGFAYYHIGDVKNSLKYDLEGLNYARQNQLTRSEAGALNRLGILYVGIGALDKAFQCYESELKIRQAINDTIYVADCYFNMGLILHKQELMEQAIINYEKAVELYHALNNTQYEAIADRAIADIYLHQKQYPRAHEYVVKSMKLDTNGGIYSSLGDYFYGVGMIDSALYYYRLALKIFTADSDRLDMARIMGNVGEMEAIKGNYNVAEPYLKQGLELATGLADLEEIGNREDGLADLYARKNDYRNAYQHHVAATIAKDSFYKAETRENLAELNTRFEVKEVEDKNKTLQNENDLQKLKLQRKNILIYGALSALAALFVIGLLLFRQSKLKANQQRVELEQKQLRAQMNPHFIFNCLNSIQNFVVANDVKNANKYLSGFASLMRQTLENSREGTITLRREEEYLENYLRLERMRFEGKFTTKIICAENLSKDSAEIPSMIIQPFVENAIRHGLCYLEDKPGELKINFYSDAKHLICEVDDNGIGREKSQKLKLDSEIVYESQGMELTRQRLALVSKTNGSDYSITVVDKKNKQNELDGTRVIIKFPLNV